MNIITPFTETVEPSLGHAVGGDQGSLIAAQSSPTGL